MKKMDQVRAELEGRLEKMRKVLKQADEEHVIVVKQHAVAKKELVKAHVVHIKAKKAYKKAARQQKKHANKVAKA